MHHMTSYDDVILFIIVCRYARAYPIHDAEGEIVRAILYVRDVTERELSEQRLLGYL